MNLALEIAGDCLGAEKGKKMGKNLDQIWLCMYRESGCFHVMV